MSSADFDPIQYWKQRHIRYAGDVRSVGHLGKSVRENELGTALTSDDLRKVITRLFNTVANLYVLDLACGIGRFAPMLADLGFHYTGVDISAVGLEQAKRSCPTGRFIEADVTSFEPDRRYELVLALYFLIHVTDDLRWRAALDVIARSLDAQGLCILMDDVPAERRCPAVHVVERSRGEYEEALAGRGLALQDAEVRNCYLIVPKRG